MTFNSDDIRAIPSGHVLTDYKFEKVLGQGSFGITYLATDVMLNRKVAIKEYFPREFAARDSTLTVRAAGNSDDRDNFNWGLRRFLEEARVLAVFDHPNIIQVRRFFEANGTAYLVMDYCDGVPLDELLKTNGVFSESQLESFLPPILDALEIIHKTNFLHRDIKPANIFIKNDGSPVLLDFGAARQELVSHSKSITAIATPGYAAFEQYSSHGNQGPWTDIYGLAATIYRAITGNKPDDATNRMLEDSLIPSAKLCSGKFRESILFAIDVAMSIKPKDRPQTIAEWRAMLKIIPLSPNSNKKRVKADSVVKNEANTLNINVEPEEKKVSEIGLQKNINQNNQPDSKSKNKVNKNSLITAGVVFSIATVGFAFYFLNDSNLNVSKSNPAITPVSISDGSIKKDEVQKQESKPIVDKNESAQPTPKKVELVKPDCPSGAPIASWNNCIGSHTYPSGATYKGEWQAGKRSGQGSGSSTNGSQYVGSWQNDTFHGYGVIKFTSGDEYKGQFLNGFFHGRGLYTWASGDKHDGQYENGKANGRGSYFFKSGRKYIGNFVNSKFDGQGTMFDANGQVVYSGTWSNGEVQSSNAKSSGDSNLEKCRLAATNAKKSTRLPYKIDSVTTLTDMFCLTSSSEKPIFTYRYEIDTSQNVNQDFLDKNIRSNNIQLVCGPDLKMYLPIVDIEYQYFYSRSPSNYNPGGLVGKLRYSSNDCR